MKIFKKATLNVALTAAMTGGALLGVSAPANAVNIAYDGLGQVLVFPYYTTRNNWETYYNITNTSDKTVLMKVRWREGRNSRDVRDFNVILSPYDVWTAATVNFGDGGAGQDVAGMVTSDNSCTFPQLLPSPAGRSGVTGVAFTNYAFTNDVAAGKNNRDGGPQGTSRTQEGYFEVIEMGYFDDNEVGNAGVLVRGAKHNQNPNNTAVPFSCNNVRTMLNPTNKANTISALKPPINALKGRAILLNKQEGAAAGYDPLALANFSRRSVYFDPDDVRPGLGNAFPPVATLVDNDGVATTVTAANGQDAVTRLISRSAVINDYNVSGNSQTDWILTFPTKNFYVDKAWFSTSNFAQIPFNGTAPLYPFTLANVGGERFGNLVTDSGQSCFDVNYRIWDQEEYQITHKVETGFSPRRNDRQNQAQLCYEANVLHFGDSDIFGTQLSAKIDSSNLPADRGWAEMSFGAQGGASLPVIGLRMEVRKRGSSAENFGFANNHAYKTETHTNGTTAAQ